MNILGIKHRNSPNNQRFTDLLRIYRQQGVLLCYSQKKTELKSEQIRTENMIKHNWKGGLLGLCLLALASCNQEDNSIKEGRIVGTDNTLCPCCGGYLMVIDQFTYRFFESDLPSGSTVLDNPTYPIDMELRFEQESDLCNGVDRISIEEIKKI
jgi:hypothetical protein